MFFHLANFGLNGPFRSRVIIIKNEKIRLTLCENAAGALYVVIVAMGAMLPPF